MSRKLFIVTNIIALLILLMMGIGTCLSGLFSLIGFTIYITACVIWCTCNFKIYCAIGR